MQYGFNNRKIIMAITYNKFPFYRVFGSAIRRIYQEQVTYQEEQPFFICVAFVNHTNIFLSAQTVCLPPTPYRQSVVFKLVIKQLTHLMPLIRFQIPPDHPPDSRIFRKNHFFQAICKHRQRGEILFETDREFSPIHNEPSR